MEALRVLRIQSETHSRISWSLIKLTIIQRSIDINDHHRASQKYYFSLKHTFNFFLYFCLKLQNNFWQQRKKMRANVCLMIILWMFFLPVFFFLQRSQNWWSNALKNAQLQSRNCWTLYNFTESKANKDRECLKIL